MALRGLTLDDGDLAFFRQWMEITADDKSPADKRAWELAQRLIAGYEAFRELARYAAHAEDCNTILDYPSDDCDCDCGYDDAHGKANTTIDVRRK